MTLRQIGGEFEQVFTGCCFDLDTAMALLQRIDEEKKKGMVPRRVPMWASPAEKKDAVWYWAWERVRHYHGRLSNLREIDGAYFASFCVGVWFVPKS